jgi:steroid delta-isomerase-like uncharacterized protein
VSSSDIARRYVDAWNARDAARLSATFAEGGTYQDPATGGPLGPAALARYAAGLWSAFPDLVFEDGGMQQCDPGSVVLRWTMRGTSRGSLLGLPPTGATIALPGVDLIQVSDTGVVRVEGFFDRATLMEQLGVQVVVQPEEAGPMHFGTCVQVRSSGERDPGAVALTIIQARSQEEVQQIRETSRRIMLQLPAMPGFLSLQAAVVGRRLTTVTLWETPEVARQVMREPIHQGASADMFGGGVGAAFHSSTWVPQRMGELWVRCLDCGALRDARTGSACKCGAARRERPAFW